MEVKVTSWLYYDISRECALLCYIRNLCETLERKPEAPDPHAAISAAVHGAMGCGQKSFKLVWLCQQLLSGFLAKGHLPRVSRQSRRSLMIRVIMK